MSTTVSRTPLSGSSLQLLVVVGLTPVLMVLVPWDFGPDMNHYRGFMRGSSLTVTFVEMLFLLIALTRGFSLFAAIRNLPELSKLGAASFLVVAAAGAVLSAKVPVYALIGIAKIVVHALFFLAISREAALGDSRFRRGLWLAAGCGVLGYCLLWLIDIAVYNPKADDWIWLVPALTHVRWVGFFALASFCSGVGTLTLNSAGQIKVTKMMLPLLFMAVGFFLAFWTATRGAMLAILITTIFASYFSRDWKAIAGLTLGAAIIAISIAIALPNVHTAYGLERLLSSAAQGQDVNGLSSNRLQLWIETLQKIGLHPWIGSGIDQFRFLGPEATLGFRHPHQSILQLLFSAGILGMVALTFVVAPLMRLLPTALPSPTEWAAASFLIAGTIYGLHDGFFYYAYPVMLYVMAIAILIKFPAPLSASDRSD